MVQLLPQFDKYNPTKFIVPGLLLSWQALARCAVVMVGIKALLMLIFALIIFSYREIAKIIGVSQPTITRMRQRLEKTAIVDYTVIPDWTELGFEIMAQTLVNTKGLPEVAEKVKKWVKNNSNVVFAAGGEGIGMDYSILSFHKNYSGYSTFIENLKTEIAENLQDIKSFLISTDKKRTLKPLSLKYLEKASEAAD